MNLHRPLDCPACGYERLRRVRAAGGAAALDRLAGDHWMCRLCGYAWQTPAQEDPRRMSDWAAL